MTTTTLSLAIALFSSVVAVASAGLTFFQARAERSTSSPKQTPRRAASTAIVVVTTVLAVAVAMVVFIATPSTPKTGFLGGDVAVGTTTGDPGWSLLSTNSYEFSGFNIDVVRYIATFSQPSWNPQFVGVTAPSRISFVEAGGGRRLGSGLAITDERLKRLDFAGPYVITKSGLAVRAGQPFPSSLTDTRGRTVCVISDSTDEPEAVAAGAIVVESVSFSDCFDKLRAGQVDFAIGPQLLLYGSSHLTPSIQVAPDVTFGSSEEYGIALPYGSYNECITLNRQIQELIASGSWNQLFAANFPGVDPVSYRPDPSRLSPCLLR